MILSLFPLFFFFFSHLVFLSSTKECVRIFALFLSGLSLPRFSLWRLFLPSRCEPAVARPFLIMSLATLRPFSYVYTFLPL